MEAPSVEATSVETPSVEATNVLTPSQKQIQKEEEDHAIAAAVTSAAVERYGVQEAAMPSHFYDQIVATPHVKTESIETSVEKKSKDSDLSSRERALHSPDDLNLRNRAVPRTTPSH